MPTAPLAVMKTKWRWFQDLVAHIEQILEGRGAVVTSPDRLPDLVTGSLREVDASIRTKVGSTEMLVTLECRKRSRKEDVRWVEELATKKEGIGAARTIAISSTGFSEAATKLARRKGIELRCLRDVTAEDIARRFLAGIRITMLVTDFKVSWFTLLADDGSTVSAADVTQALPATLRQDGLDTPFLHFLPNREPVTMNRLLAEVPEPDLPEDGTPVTKVCTGVFAPGLVVVMTRTGEKTVKGIRLRVTYRRQSKLVDPLSLLQYGGPTGTIIEVMQGEAELDDKTVEVTAFLNRGKDTEPPDGA